MPSVYTHFLVARQSLLALPPQIQNRIKPYLALYYFGAQGADFCFFYKFLQRKKGNLGSHLHRKGGFITFQALQAFAAQSPAIFAYAAGYITHYAADSILHPYVYATAGKSLLTHTRLESALDYQYGKHYAQASREDYKQYFRPQLEKEEKNQLFSLYAEITKNCGFPPLVRPTFFRAISVFNAYLPLSFTLLTHQRSKLLQTAFGKNYEQKTADLLQSICLRARMLTDEFLQTIETSSPLPKPLFDKSFLTGKSIE